MRTKTNVKAARRLNHNERLVNPDARTVRQPAGLKVKTSLKAGRYGAIKW
jgi:hypothetical protein